MSFVTPKHVCGVMLTASSRLSSSCLLRRHASSSSHYRDLGLEPLSSFAAAKSPPSQKEIKKAYLEMVRLHHPDVSPDPESAEKFRKAQEAYNALSKGAAGDAGGGGGDGSHV